MPELHYLIGDATLPIKLPAMIIHIVNNAGGFGKGFVVALKNRYPETEKQYRNWFATGKPQLGEVQFVQVTPEICVANMVAQHGIRWEGKVPPIRYDSLETCLTESYEKALKEKLIVVGPRVGAVLSGGHWPTIEGLIKKTMTVETYIYTLESQKDRWPTKYEV